MIRRIQIVALSLALIGIFATALFGQVDVKLDIFLSSTARIKIGIPPFKQNPESLQDAQQGRKIIGSVQFYPYTVLGVSTRAEYLRMKADGDRKNRERREREEGLQ